ncbi:MAG: nucleotidyltransferase domain-containing protein [Candidatus Hydrogenedentota bacterium]|nr:MAG: nucleotidyltransferase domain-containing protein [Candidatus Hydrogenedentota bacterium]
MTLKEDIRARFLAEKPRLIEALRRYRPERVYLFGSFAHGDVNAHSDIDLCIIKRTKRRFLDRIEEVSRLLNSSFPLEVLVYTPEEMEAMRRMRVPLARVILEEGERLL